MYGRPSVSSWSSSIPEVLGCCAHYVNPYSAQSIAKGMAYMTKDHILNEFEKRINELFPSLEQRGHFDGKVVLKNILENQFDHEIR